MWFDLDFKPQVCHKTLVPIFWECQRCTACCRWPGQVKLTGSEITRMASFLGLNETDFIQRFTRLRSDRKGLVLEEQSDGACIFFDNGDCRIQPIKPQQCLDFPNLWRYSEPDKCRARPIEMDMEAYVERLKQVTRREVITEGMLASAEGVSIKDSEPAVPR